HDEGSNPDGTQNWSEYGSYAQNTKRLFDNVATSTPPVKVDGATVQSFDLYNGNTLTITTPSGTAPNLQSERVTETFTRGLFATFFGGKTKDVANYYDPSDAGAPKVEVDDVVTSRGPINQTVAAKVYVANDTLEIDVPAAVSTTLTAAGEGVSLG